MQKKTSSEQTSNIKRMSVKEENIKHINLRNNQREYVNQILKNDITFCSGPAGTSKTFTACYTSLFLLAEKKVKKIILCKPIQESGEKLGFLPGDIKDKIDPYMQSYISNFNKIVGNELTESLLHHGLIEFKPLAFMRGDTFDDAFMILDEAQNATFKQLMLFTTRMGKSSKVLVTGDISQYDIPKANAGISGFIQLMEGIRGVGHHKFGNSDIVRAKILQEVVDRYDKWMIDNPNK